MLVERIKILQLIVGSLLCGPLLLCAITLGIHGIPPWTEIPRDTLSMFALVLAFVGTAASVVVPRLLDQAKERALRTAGNMSLVEEQLSDHLQTRTLVGAALLEGVVFLLLVANLVRAHLLLLLIASGLLVVMLIAYFPTQSRAELWLTRRREGIAQRKTLE
jgi:hypothetical protein